ncbi:GntR family transcriptional regulator [Arthrobacter cupressi]|uniref:DNA-binding transcriptional regulator, GntR family n=1 Tax=Arthrobacter cupressi TaxID=1045773 RepID=A0A1G8SGW9_9MICC|nr:GntR family transcriptional regulator [Arthrobacter cupressi]NYD78521.1 DNA-binding GntR family transcriptional regulator [Arthrobacter cupressi]SDJ27900.1 DNA-binding transcriptional regulator, GntR family [Arthrobacter cupressi]
MSTDSTSAATTGSPFVLEGRPTAQLIADQLREQIVQGAFLPGQQVNESVLAVQLNTSRGPIREALQRLSQEGILVNKRNRGVFVRELTSEDIREIYAVRQALESTAAQELLDAPPETIEETCSILKDTLAEMAKQVAVSDWPAIARLDMQFHTSFVAGTGNSRLIRSYKTLAAESRMCILNLEVSYPRVDVLVEEHQVLLDLLARRDRKALLRAIRQHMEKAVEDLTTQHDKALGA